MIQTLIKPFIWIMDFCYKFTHNYGWAIILFTFVTKIIMMPVSVWLQKYSIKMVKMQPELNSIRVQYFGDKEKISEEEANIYKKYKYNPFISIIPTIIQLILLIAVIEVIKLGINTNTMEMSFLGLSVATIPSKEGGLYLLSPILAAVSAFFMCIAQNKSNVIQVEQSEISKIITMIISVGLSLYLGFFVTFGVVIYWVSSNIFAIATLYFLNLCINPKKYVDYEELEKSRKALIELKKIGKENETDIRIKRELDRREKQDYKRFFSVVNKHLVFYSESNGFYKYYSGLIEYLMDHSNITIHYITSDPKDRIFEMAEDNSRIKAYYIGEKRLITLMMKMDAEIVVMTMPDIDNYHIKRSYVKKDIEYIYVQHGIGSVNLLLRKGAIDHYDTIFCCGETQKAEILAMEEYYRTPAKKLVECGYFLLDDMLSAYENMELPKDKNIKTILIAPSWQEGNIIDSCLPELLHQLSSLNYNIIVRPHPQHVRHEKEKLELIREKYTEVPNIHFQLDFSSTDTVWKSDILITDWSDISTEYAFCTKHPVLFVDTKMKVMNPEWDKINVVPLNIAVRNIIGKSISVDSINQAAEVIEELFSKEEEYKKSIEDYMSRELYSLRNSSSVGGKYIINQLLKKKADKKL